MGKLFHVNPATGNTGPCGAQAGNCPYGSSEVHAATPEAARELYEKAMAAEAVPAPLSSQVPTADTYGLSALSALEELDALLAEPEADPRPAHQYHEALAQAYERFAHESENAAVYAPSDEESDSWVRTTVEAYAQEAAHHRMALELTPRDQRGDREEWRRAMLQAFANEDSSQDALDDLPAVDLRTSPWQHADLAAQLHREWAEARGREPKWEDDGFGAPIDLANTDFFLLPYHLQEENVKAATSALNRVEESNGNVEVAAARIHQDWLERNASSAEAHQQVPFTQLSPEEREKDRALARAALDLLRGPLL